MYKYTDTEILDWIQEQNNKKSYTGLCMFRYSVTGRGWRFHETSLGEIQNFNRTGFDDIRLALIDAMDNPNIESPTYNKDPEDIK